MKNASLLLVRFPRIWGGKSVRWDLSRPEGRATHGASPAQGTRAVSFSRSSLGVCFWVLTGGFSSKSNSRIVNVLYILYVIKITQKPCSGWLIGLVTIAWWHTGTSLFWSYKRAKRQASAGSHSAAFPGRLHRKSLFLSSPSCLKRADRRAGGSRDEKWVA